MMFMNRVYKIIVSYNKRGMTQIIIQELRGGRSAPAFGEITTACNVGQAKKGHGACLKSGQLVYARFHTRSHRCCREMYFNSRLNVNFLDSTQNIGKVSGA